MSTRACFATARIPDTDTGGVRVRAADSSLLAALGANYPTVVLGAEAAKRLGITNVDSRPRVWLGGRGFTVIGILAPITLASDALGARRLSRGAAAAGQRRQMIMSTLTALSASTVRCGRPRPGCAGRP